MDYGTGAIFGCPAHDQRDLDFARKYNLPVTEVVCPDGEEAETFSVKDVAYTGPGTIMNSGSWNGLNIEKPKVGLLNVGTEEHKGRAELHRAYELIEKNCDPAIFSFVGFVEGGDITSDKADVIVTDGFTGNIALKTGEGTAALIGNLLKEAFAYTPLSRLASFLAVTSLRRLRKRIDPRRVNGGVFLGLNGTVVKSHGSADATGVAAAVKLAVQLVENNFSEKIAARVASANTIQQT